MLHDGRTIVTIYTNVSYYKNTKSYIGNTPFEIITIRMLYDINDI